MDQRKQTAVTDSNREEFYNTLFPVVSMTKNQMIDISDLENPVLIDCAGKFYKQEFSTQILVVETLQTAKEFCLERTDFDFLVKDDDNIRWPSKMPKNSDIVFDDSRLTKYKTLNQLQDLLQNLINQCRPNSIHFRIHLHHIDDDRLCDRFYNISLLKFNNYVVLKFLYDTKKNIFELSLKRKHEDTN